jgi:hypothetical protein
MSDDETWAQLRTDLRRPDLPKEAVWDAVFAATEEGCDIRWFGDDCLLLDLAFRDGLPCVVQRLMAMGINPATPSGGHGWNVMHVAAKGCTSPKVFMVLPVELLTSVSSSGSTPLHIAVQFRNAQAVQWMLDQPCCPVEAKNAIGTARDCVWEMDPRPEVVAICAAFAARKRWTALRAAWVGAVITCAK